jgi:DNA transformation protein
MRRPDDQALSPGLAGVRRAAAEWRPARDQATMADSEFVSYVVESLRPLGPVGARRMFGGHGIFLDGLMFALIASDQLYLKVDDGNRAAYEAAGLPPFTYDGKGKPIQMSYHEAPSEGFDDPDVLCAWAREAYAAALRSRAAAKPRARPRAQAR